MPGGLKAGWLLACWINGLLGAKCKVLVIGTVVPHARRSERSADLLDHIREEITIFIVT